MRINLIRHGLTAGNLTKCYIGRTDEPLCQLGIDGIKGRSYPRANIVISSPMIRCIETAGLIYPLLTPIINDGLRECDFGDFEGRNYHELCGDKRYQEWIDSGGSSAFPNGELPDDFRERSCKAFLESVRKLPQDRDISMVVHGGTIMSVMSRFCDPPRGYFDCIVENGCGYVTDWNGKIITVISELK